MASIRKLSRDKGKKNKPYWIQYLDHDGKRVTAKGFTDKALTEQLAAKLENEVMLRKRGMIDPAQERLLAIKQSAINEHLDAFDRSMANNTLKHRKLTMTRVRRVVESCGFRTLAEMDGEKVVDWLNTTREAEDMGARTYNHYLQAADAFGKWLAATKRLPSNPLAGMERLNSETDVRHKRRALTHEEVSRLVESARSSGVDVQGYDGELRARAYLVSFFTVLRRQEIGSLTPRSFRLDDPQPTLVVEAACSKHRRKDTLPLHPDLVVMVRAWIDGMQPDDLLFPRIERKKTWLMVKKDLERVGIPYETPDGIADFHAAGRHSHITGLVRSGASIMEAKELARHADIRQTAKYTHIGMEDRAEALAGLPSPKVSATLDGLHYVCNSGVVQRQEVAPDVRDAGSPAGSINEQSPAGGGLASSVVTNCHQLTVCGEVEAAGFPRQRRNCCKLRTYIKSPRLIGPLIGNQSGVFHAGFRQTRRKAPST